MSDLSDIISRLEALTGPSRELGDEVLRAYGWTTPTGGGWPNDRFWSQPNGQTYGGVGERPDPTASVDAALALLPDDSWEWNLAWNSGFGFAEVGDPTLHMEGEHKTPAIALCIASLRAREADRGGER